MSFITKRERVFNEYDLFDLPARNEGKLKAYASCTDARAWSHFNSDKSEHLVEIIKRNNDICPAKYVPTDVIVNTLMVAKNTEIARLKRKIEEFEQMLAAYDQLDLTCEQKCEIAKAHAAIKAATKELDELCLDLDLSGFTEGVESDAFETGKSRGDELAKCRGDEWIIEKPPMPIVEDKSNQAGLTCPCDASTSVQDPRIQEMQESIISKDAKLSAMQNTIAVMENDVCEPYCIYAHINTALEKIFGILCQNDKYKLYLNMMVAGKDTRCINIKGKILFKLKVLEKFCLALIAPCSQETASPPHDCSCFRAELIQRVETAFALTSAESKQPCLDNKRAHLVADIMENDEMKEILSKDSDSEKIRDDTADDGYVIESYNIDAENLKRLKNLQENYDDLMTCYETLKHEKVCLELRWKKNEDLEKEYEALKDQLREYNLLWNEKEHYRKRSADLDSLKEQYLVLTDETTNLETQLKAESEINSIKSNTIEELRNENLALEKKLNDALIAFEKEKSNLQCKLKETECKVMCQEQQIKSLSTQVDRLLEKEQDKLSLTHEDPAHSIMLIDEIESLKDQIKNLKDTLLCNEEEAQTLQEDFQDKLKEINKLKMEIEDWKSTYEKTLQRNNYLENYMQNVHDEVRRLIEENRDLSQQVEEKHIAVENLINVINSKSQEVNKLMDDLETKTSENSDLFSQLCQLREKYDINIETIKQEKTEALESLMLAKRESQDLLDKVKDYDYLAKKYSEISKSLDDRNADYNELKKVLLSTNEENKNLQKIIITQEYNNTKLQQEVQRLMEANAHAVSSLHSLSSERNQYKASLELTRKESEILEHKLTHLEKLTQDLQNLRESHEKLINEKKNLMQELQDKTQKLNTANQSVQLSHKENLDLKDKLNKSESLKNELIVLNESHKKLRNEQHALHNELCNKNKELCDKSKEIDDLVMSLNDLKTNNYNLLKKIEQVPILNQKLSELQRDYEKLLAEKELLQSDLNNKTEGMNNLYNTLESKIEENRGLYNQIQLLENNNKAAKSDITTLQNENIAAHTTINTIKKESTVLVDKIKYYETVEQDYEKLKQAHDQMEAEKEQLQKELNRQLEDLKRIERENNALNAESQNLLRHSEDLEKALINTRNQVIEKSDLTEDPYAVIKKEIEDMKREKQQNQKRIRELLDKLDESENIISNFSEDILARDNKIAILQNHINELEDEVRLLQEDLAKMIETGEEIKSASYEKIDQSIRSMDAHHSKATHNMKMELAKLQNDKIKLEEKLSVTKSQSEESLKIKNKYISQIKVLQNEREIIITDIKQLELQSVGDSALSPNNCAVEDILNSLDRIRKILDARTSKNNSLEKTLLKVQTSSQLLLSEAKEIVEKEKQKIINEKEEAIRDRLNMQRQLENQKEKLEKQISIEKGVIKDLEAEILNQKLIIDKINKSTQEYISKLKEEMHSLQNLYQNSLSLINELQEKIQQMSQEENKNLEIIKKLNVDLEQKLKDVSILQKALDDCKNKPMQNLGVQVQLSKDQRNISIQFDNEVKFSEDNKKIKKNDTDFYNANLKDIDDTMDVSNIKIPEFNKPTDEKTGIFPKQKPHSVHEVQILTANVEPSFDFIRNSYLNYKLKQLSPGRLEQYSISHDENMSMDNQDEVGETSTSIPENTSPNTNLIDIYNRHSLQTNSSKVIYDDNISLINHDPESPPTKTSAFTALGLANENTRTDTNANKNKYRANFIDSESGKSVDKDFFVIYKDSETNYPDKNFDDQGPWNVNGHSEVLVETAQMPKKGAIYEKNIIKKDKKHKSHKHQQFYHDVEDNDHDDDSVKPKLDINLPRVVVSDSPSVLTTSDGDKKSVSSYNMAIYSSPNHITLSNTKLNKDLDSKSNIQNHPSLPTFSNDDDQLVYSYNSFQIPPHENTDPYYKKRLDSNKQNTKTFKELTEAESHHKLSRVGADVYLIKSTDHKKNNNYNDNQTASPDKTSLNFGLQYILDTVQQEVRPETRQALKALRKTQSDECFNQLKLHEDSISSPSKLSATKISLDYKTESSFSQSKTSESQSKSFVERSVMAKIDNTEDYEAKINYLTKTLENIEMDYKKKIEVIKVQYDSNIKSIINEHNQGVKSIQNLHEETLQDIIKIHENEVENLRTLSIEAMRKSDKLEKENRVLKRKIQDYSSGVETEPTKMACSCDVKKRRKSRIDTKTLTKTNVEAFNVKPKFRSHGPCTCSLDVNLSDTIRNIFEQVDVEQRKMAELAYMKYIANKILTNNVEALDAQELSFLHLKVCRVWKMKLSKEEVLQKRIDSLEHELLNKQRYAQQHIAELDRKVAEERRRLQEVREAVCRSPNGSRSCSPDTETRHLPTPVPAATAQNDFLCNCNTAPPQTVQEFELPERRSAGDLACNLPTTNSRLKRTRTDSNRAVLAKLDVEERREKKLYNDEPPTRLRRSHGNEKQTRFHKK